MSGTENISNINWIEMGPTNIGGRTRTILIDSKDPTGNTLWAGGGLQEGYGKVRMEEIAGK